jgi:hypothetical protein
MKINDVPVYTEEQIINTLQQVFDGSKDFAVLERDGQHFIQTDDNSMEYKKPAGLYKSVREDFTSQELADLFLEYYHGVYDKLNSNEWREIPGFSAWEPEEKDDRPPPKTLREKIHRLFGL